MSEVVRSLSIQAWRWRVILFKGCNGYFQVLIAAMCGANIFSPKTTSILLCFVAGSKFIEGFINQDIARIVSGPSGDTQQFTINKTTTP